MIVDLAKKPPILFPLVGLFHIVWFLITFWSLVSDKHVPFGGVEWLQVLWFGGYTFFWLVVCDMKRWGALGYILLTLLNVSLYLAIRNGKISAVYLSNMFLLDGVFSFFLLFYYKRFDHGSSVKAADKI